MDEFANVSGIWHIAYCGVCGSHSLCVNMFKAVSLSGDPISIPGLFSVCSPTDELGGILVSCADFLDKMNHAEAAFTKLIESGLLLASQEEIKRHFLRWMVFIFREIDNAIHLMMRF